jgi:hypothetical protein
MGAMRITRFTPTPAEIRECVPQKEDLRLALNALPPESPMTQAEAEEFLAKARVDLAPILKSIPDGAIEITEEMRERHREKTRQAVERFGKTV